LLALLETTFKNKKHKLLYLRIKLVVEFKFSIRI
jgi:hypothetical protein